MFASLKALETGCYDLLVRREKKGLKVQEKENNKKKKLRAMASNLLAMKKGLKSKGCKERRNIKELC